jgi:hypothetical protein
MDLRALTQLQVEKGEREHLARTSRHQVAQATSIFETHFGKMPKRATWKVALPGRATRVSH